MRKKLKTIDKVPKKLDIAGKERKRKEREQERKIEIDSPPPSPPKRNKFWLMRMHSNKNEA